MNEPKKRGRPKQARPLAPKGTTRLTIHVRDDLLIRLKVAAARRLTTVGKLVEELIADHIKDS